MIKFLYLNLILILIASIFAQKEEFQNILFQNDLYDIEIFLTKKNILQKLDNSSLDIQSAEENFGIRERPFVKQISPFCTTAVQRLKAGPPNIPSLICNAT